MNSLRNRSQAVDTSIMPSTSDSPSSLPQIILKQLHSSLYGVKFELHKTDTREPLDIVIYEHIRKSLHAILAPNFIHPDIVVMDDFTKEYTPASIETGLTLDKIIGLELKSYIKDRSSIEYNSSWPTGRCIICDQHGTEIQIRCFYLLAQLNDFGNHIFSIKSLVICDGDFINTEHREMRSEKITKVGSSKDGVIRVRPMVSFSNILASPEMSDCFTLIENAQDVLPVAVNKEVGRISRNEHNWICYRTLESNDCQPFYLDNPCVDRSSTDDVKDKNRFTIFCKKYAIF